MFLFPSQSSKIWKFTKNKFFSCYCFVSLKMLMWCQHKFQNRLSGKNNSEARHLSSSSSTVPSSPLPQFAPPLQAMWCIIVFPSTNLLTKRLYIFFTNLRPNVISLKVICILNLIADCGSKEFNTLLRGF